MLRWKVMANGEDHTVARPSAGLNENKTSTASSSQVDRDISTQPILRNVHLVGSVPLINEEAVFRMVSSILGERIHRIPDGETGERIQWIFCQLGILTSNLSLELASDGEIEVGKIFQQFRLRSNADPDKVSFDNLGYADYAIKSYQTFARLKKEGVIGVATRFLVSLPTPFATIITFVDNASQAAVEPPYEAQMLKEVDRMCAVIPHDQLAIQWDFAVEFAVLEGIPVWEPYLDDVYSGVLERLARISEHVLPDVEMGYHFCYGDLNHEHFMQPKDATKLVTIANDISTRVVRQINWLHMPVPRDRDDDAYFAPLTNLRLHPETELYLGLVHYTDGVAGAQKRIATAQRFAPPFGIATECGLGRRPSETIAPLLEIHHTLATNTN